MFFRVPIVPVTKIFWYNPFSGIITGMLFSTLVPRFRLSSPGATLVIFIFFLKEILKNFEYKLQEIKE